MYLDEEADSSSVVFVSDFPSATLTSTIAFEQSEESVACSRALVSISFSDSTLLSSAEADLLAEPIPSPNSSIFISTSWTFSSSSVPLSICF